MQTKIAFLKALFSTEKEITGRVDFYAMKRSFYFYLNKSGMSKPAYESFVNKLYGEGLIKIDLHGCNSFDDATVSATNAAVAYIENAGRPKIGF